MRKDLPVPRRSRARAGPCREAAWRAADPALPDDVRARLLHHLGVARSAVRTAGDDAARAAARARVQLTKTGLGERGTPWWGQYDAARRARWEAALAALEAPGG